MSTITINGFVLPGWNSTATGLELWIYSSASWVDIDGGEHGAGNKADTTFVKRVTGLTSSILARTLTVPSFTLVSTTDARKGSDVRMRFQVMSVNGPRRAFIADLPNTEDGLRIPPTISSLSGCSPSGTCCSIGELVLWNQLNDPRPDPFSTYSRLEIDERLASLSFAGTWGGITGTLANQDDLQAALDSKIPVFNVKAAPYNVTGDGVTDEIDGLELAMADAALVNGIVYLPVGTYAVSRSWESADGVTVGCAGWDGARIKAHDDWSPGTTVGLITVTGDRVAVCNLGFISNAKSVMGVEVVGSADSRVEHCRFDSTCAWGVMIRASSHDVTVNDCLIDGATSNGIEINDSSYNIISNNHIKNTVSNGIELFLNVTVGEEVGNRLINNHIENCNGGIVVVGDRNTIIEGGVVRNTTVLGFSADLQTISAVNYKSTGGSMSGVMFINNGEVTYEGVTFGSGSTGWTMSGGSVSRSGAQGIVIRGSNHKIGGVQVYENRTDGIIGIENAHTIVANIVWDNSVSGAGNAHGINYQGTNGVIANNRVTDTRTPKLQAYGVVVTGNSNTVVGNDLTGNLTGPVFDGGTSNLVFDRNAGLMLVSPAAGTLPFSITGASGQSTDFLRVKTSAGVVLVSVSPFGALTIRPTTSGITTFEIEDSLGNNRFRVTDSGITRMFAAPSTALALSQSSPSLEAISTRWNGSASVVERYTFATIRAGDGAGQYQGQWRDEAGTLVLAFDNGTSVFGGGIRPAHLADAAAPVDTTYFSTDASKLVYKDSGGTVHALY